MTRWWTAFVSIVSLTGCAFDGPAPGGPEPGDEMDGGDDIDGGVEGSEPGCPLAIDPDARRPLALMDRGRLASFAARMPRAVDCGLRDLLESADTVFYDNRSIIPGYQDSFGDNVITPIGMRPNTIRSELIDLAVPGGHAQIFAARGRFHFPFGRGEVSEVTHIVDFWNIPRDSSGALLPVVTWQRDPNEITHRVEWMFPAGTVLGEIIFITGAGDPLPFEIRTRRRLVDRWTVDVFRPFPTAAELIDAVDERQDRSVAALIAHLRDPATLVPARLEADHFDGAFAPIDGAEDRLPALDDAGLVESLLLETPYRSARGAIWREAGELRAYAPTTSAALHIVPAGNDAGFLSVDDESCARCHENAGRPFRDYYPNITAYGELWGEDGVFSWHPFEAGQFVDDDGAVVNFNNDNRRMRQDMIDAGVLAPYDPALHPGSVYATLPGEWKGYAY